MSTIFDLSEKGKNKYYSDAKDVKVDDIPQAYLRGRLNLPDVNETEVVRHYTGLSHLNFGVDTGMYPLGSCTMKHNPKLNERIAAMPGFAGLHPAADEGLSQGALRVMHELSGYLCAITGMDAFTLQPAAGAHGELTAVMMIKKYFEDTGEKRGTILIPDSAHGTNPASVAICGFEIKSVPSSPDGDVDIDALRGLITPDVAAMMLTSPSTLGLFDRRILEIASLLHKNESLFYCDGANLNAVMGKARVADMGFDLMHINLHKTFSTPHGGGGPGSGPVGVTERLSKYLPVPTVEKEGNEYRLVSDRPKSIGCVHSFYGNFQVALKAWTYITVLGPDGIRDVSEKAVLNANYLKEKLRTRYNLPIDRTCMHEFVLNDRNVPNGVTTNDIAKRLLDYGFHAPTVYFPLIIEGAMMIEPTETESLSSLDGFVEAMFAILDEAETEPELVKSAPCSLKFRRVDAVTAARKPVLKWEP